MGALFRNISFKLLVLLLLAVLVPLLGGGFYAITSSIRFLTAEIYRSNQNIARRGAGLIRNSFDAMEKQVGQAVELMDLANQDAGDLEWSLAELMTYFPEVSLFAVVDNTGAEITKISKNKVFFPEDLRNRSADPLVRKALNGEKLYSKIDFSDPGNLSIQYLVPLLDVGAGRISGCLVAEFSLRHLFSELTRLEVGSTGAIYVVDRYGSLVAHSDNSLVSTGSDFTGNPLVSGFKDENPVANGRYQGRDDQPLLTVAESIGRPDLLVVIDIPAGDALAAVARMTSVLLGILAGVLATCAAIFFYFFRILVRPLKELEAGVRHVSEGNFAVQVPVLSDDEVGRVASAFNSLAANLDAMKQEEARVNWLKTNQAELDALLRGDQSVAVLSEKVISFLATRLNAQVAAFYASNGADAFVFCAGYALAGDDLPGDTFKSGEGVIGQAAVSGGMIRLGKVPAGYLRIRSGLGSDDPQAILVVPFVHNQAVLGVAELGFIGESGSNVETFLEQSRDSIAIALHSAMARSELQEALKTMQELNEENLAQQEELRIAGEAAEQKNRQLQASEEILQSQQEELRAANEELQEKASLLEKMLQTERETIQP